MHSPNPSRSNSREPLYRATSLKARSRSPSPDPGPTPQPQLDYYGSANLTDRSRSPSPASTAASSSRRKRAPRKLPATPQKPSSLNLAQAKKHPGAKMPHVLPSPTIPQPHKSPGSINFPKLNASPTRLPIAGSPTAAPQPQPRPDPAARARGYDDRRQPAARTGSHDRLNRDRSRDRSRYSSPMLNNARPDRRSPGDRHPAAIARSVSSSNLPNGFKPRPSRASRDRTRDLRPSPGTQSAAHSEHSDESDEDDWC
ncbi:hypothetical protein LSH36_59g03001 [Paralvinella palmiformis]|uniref:Uncharacterized protein n=1 Tax=Paralvinella palmiformis TaxID=53620 RepID=A0AAD9K4I0_9ANNE|nr:hypothetical protein LSH36_59g03001 [Paralvinella palmiformis]